MTSRPFSWNASAPGGGTSFRGMRAGPVVLILCAVLLGAAVTRHTGAATTPFVAVDLGTLGGDFSFAYAVNARGEVVGDSFTAGNAADHAFSWTSAGGMIDLGTLGGDVSYAYAVNARGDIVGDSTTVTGADHPSPVHAVLWRSSATPHRRASDDDEVEAGPGVERDTREGDDGGDCHRRGEWRDAEREGE